MVEHKVRWTSPAPLWSVATASAETEVRRSFSQPAILRFTTDTFMDDFMGMLEKDPQQLSSLVAQPETWRGPLDASSAVTGSGPAPRVPKLVRKFERLRLASGRSKGGTSTSETGTKALFRNKSNAGMLKLYQPAHQRYYLVSSCLVCGITGMPDRAVNPGREERASFVIRRMLPPGRLDANEALPEFDATTWEEYAYAVTPDGTGWQRIGKRSDSAVESLVTGEEQLPFFTVKYQEDDDRTRRLFAGLIPVGKREAYMAAGTVSGDERSKSVDRPLPKTSRKILFRSQVAEPWKNVIDQSERLKTILDKLGAIPPPDPFPSQAEQDSLVKAAREQIQTQSWLVLLDLADFLNQYVPNVWDAITTPSKESGLESAEAILLTALKNTKTTSGSNSIKTELTKSWLDSNDNVVHSPYSTSDIKNSLYYALRAIVGVREKLESATGSYDRTTKDDTWPTFLFPLADPKVTALTFSDDVEPLSEEDQVDVEVTMSVNETVDVETAKRNVDNLVALVVRAMPTDAAGPVPPVPAASQPLIDTREGVFIIRAVFERPNCGPLKPTVVSEPSLPFQLAGFFDPDAPARPIRIALPIDTSPAGLRKFDKNTAFMISDVLCGQIQRAKGLSLGDLVLSVLPWPFHKDLPVPDGGPCQTDTGTQLGMICTLSIPIITICALILLMIIVNLLDIIFRWIPYLIMCFPLPGFKAKK
jgi:hypothetical protein